MTEFSGKREEKVKTHKPTAEHEIAARCCESLAMTHEGTFCNYKALLT